MSRPPDVRDGGGPDAVDVPIVVDGGADAGTDTGADAGMDTGGDAGTDARMDTGGDAGSGPSAQIAAVRAAPRGAVDLPITGALVTYVVAGSVLADGGVSANDPAGFFVQADRTGPALFVAVDPAGLTPRPAVGDAVSFRVTNTDSARTGAVWATAVTGWTRTGMGNPIAPLVQDLSATPDLVTGLTGYESEVLRVAGTVATDFAGAGTGFESAQITTMGVPTAMPNLRIRVPAALRASAGLRNGCQFVVNAAPLWRFNAQAQVAAWVAADVTVGTCPPVTDGGVDGGDAAADVATDASPVDAGMDVAPTDAATPSLVVNEVQTRGVGGAAADEFVEIFNRGTSAVSLAGWTVRYASAGSDTTGNLSWTGEAGLMIPAGGYVVLASAGFAGTVVAGGIRSTAVLTQGMSDTGGQVGLLDPAGVRVDSVAYGAITAASPMFREGAMAAPIGTGMPIATARVPNGADTNSNSADFVSRMAVSAGGPNS